MRGVVYYFTGSDVAQKNDSAAVGRCLRLVSDQRQAALQVTFNSYAINLGAYFEEIFIGNSFDQGA